MKNPMSAKLRRVRLLSTPAAAITVTVFFAAACTSAKPAVPVNPPYGVTGTNAQPSGDQASAAAPGPASPSNAGTPRASAPSAPVASPPATVAAPVPRPTPGVSGSPTPSGTQTTDPQNPVDLRRPTTPPPSPGH